MFVPHNMSASIHSREREYTAKRRAYFFGQFRLLQDKQLIGELSWRRNKAKALLKWFLLNPGKLYAADQLIDLFWSEITEDAASRNLHVTMHYLRHLLEPDLQPRQDSSFIKRNKNNFYWFEVDEEWWTDIFEVHYLYKTAVVCDKRVELEKAIFCYRKIVNYCSLEFLPEDPENEAFKLYRRQYENIYYQALMRLIQLYQERNEYEEVLEYAYQALNLDYSCEIAVKAIAKVHYKQGKCAEAIHKLDEFKQFLRKVLGVEPSKDIFLMRERIIKRESMHLL